MTTRTVNRFAPVAVTPDTPQTPTTKDPRVDKEIDIPPFVPNLDIDTYNREVRAALIRDRGHARRLSSSQCQQVRSLYSQFPWLTVDFRAKVALYNAFQGRTTPEDLMSLIDPSSVFAVTIPRNKYYWDTKADPPRFNKVPISDREKDEKFIAAFTGLTQFTVAWIIFTTCLTSGYGGDDMTSNCRKVVTAANWHLLFITGLVGKYSLSRALRYHLLVHRARMSFDRPFNRKDWYFRIDQDAYQQAILEEEADEEADLYS